MRCPQCDYYWCWVCGLPVYHWIHKFSENPFGCKYAPKDACSMVIKFIIFLLGLALIPTFLILAPIFVGLGYGMYGGAYIGCAPCSGKSCCVMMLRILAIIPICVLGGLGAAAGCIGAAIGALITVPVLFLHSYMFLRSLYWWSKNRGRPENEPSKMKTNYL